MNDNLWILALVAIAVVPGAIQIFIAPLPGAEQRMADAKRHAKTAKKPH